MLGEVSFGIRTLPNHKRNGARSYYYIVYYVRSMLQSLLSKINVTKYKEYSRYSTYLGVRMYDLFKPVAQ